MDQLLYAVEIVQSKSDPPPDGHVLQFPICDTPSGFADGRQQRRIRSLSQSVRTEIEKAQPYNRPRPETPPLLSILRDFDDRDKHRLLQFAISQPVKGEFSGISGLAPGGQLVTLVSHEGYVKNGTEIAAIELKSPAPDMHYENFSVDFGISVGHATGPQGHDKTLVDGLLNDLVDEVESVISNIKKVV